MVKYTSRYTQYGFYVNGDLKRFSNGTYSTDDKDETTVLDAIADVTKVAEPVPQAPTKQTEAKPATKAPARKPSAK